jgi:hypothetical protein
VGVAMERVRIASGRSRVAVALVILALLAFTTVRTSPLSTGLEHGSSLSKTTPKQRQLSVKKIVWTFPLLNDLAIVSLDYGDVIPVKLADFSCDHFSGRYFSLPPPVA